MNTGSMDPEPGEPVLPVPQSLGYITLASCCPEPPGKPWKPILFLSQKNKKKIFLKIFDIPDLYLRIYRGLFAPSWIRLREIGRLMTL